MNIARSATFAAISTAVVLAMASACRAPAPVDGGDALRPITSFERHLSREGFDIASDPASPEWAVGGGAGLARTFNLIWYSVSGGGADLDPEVGQTVAFAFTPIATSSSTPMQLLVAGVDDRGASIIELVELRHPILDSVTGDWILRAPERSVLFDEFTAGYVSALRELEGVPHTILAVLHGTGQVVTIDTGSDTVQVVAAESPLSGMPDFPLGSDRWVTLIETLEFPGHGFAYLVHTDMDRSSYADIGDPPAGLTTQEEHDWIESQRRMRTWDVLLLDSTGLGVIDGSEISDFETPPYGLAGDLADFAID
ncbi:hypothetical protein Pla163_02780 [Planctomycetes bacterium Pla163]|uniref:Uncharacterized protein n=1 Tax=Rohdeia mirabilis TaxID=2528008 RepID=A0A518CVE0_9BACT|nr:hypothetical protein Pla163_02780 [Planctomycetes bacterium Pla163]